ncbi:MAG: hypothetical protein WCO12_00570 [bacterium]
MSRVKYRSAEALQKRRRSFKRVSIFLSIGIVFIFIGLVFFLRMDRFQIRDVNIEGARIIQESDLRKSVDDTLSGSYVWLIPKSNTFIYNLGTLKSYLLEEFPGIQSITLARDGFNKISLNIEERKPHVLWCPDKDEVDQQCYFIDDTGLLFAEAPSFSGNVYFIFRGKLDKDTPLGARLMSQQDFTSFEQFISLITKNLHVDIVGVTFKEVGDFDLDLASGTKILFNKTLSYDDMYNNFGSVLKSDQFASSTINSLEYLDMRFGNKIFFKNKVSN